MTEPPIEVDTLYFDHADDAFCRIVWDSDEQVLALETPDGDDQYKEFADMEEFHPSDFSRIEDAAIEDPAGFIEAFLSQSEQADTLSLGHPDMRASFTWARKHTRIVETTEDDDD